MQKVRIQLVSLGHLPAGFRFNGIFAWESDVFEVSRKVLHYDLPVILEHNDLRKHDYRVHSRAADWEYLDSTLLYNLKQNLPDNIDGDFVIAITNVPLERLHNVRRIGDNKIVVTFFGISDIISQHNIPLDNLILRILYGSMLVYLRTGMRIPSIEEKYNYSHDEVRDCLFDLRAIKSDVLSSLNKPKLCKECIARLQAEKVTDDTIEQTRQELKRIRKTLYYRMADFIKKHPIWSLFISAMFALLWGIVGNLLASRLYDFIYNGH